MEKYLIVSLGAALGGSVRYWLSNVVYKILPSTFPYGTLTVNILGSFILGFIIYSVSLGRNISPEMRDFITIGMLGGFTTMSAFAYESFRLMELNQMMLFALNIALNVILCIAAVYAGKELAVMIAK